MDGSFDPGHRVISQIEGIAASLEQDTAAASDECLESYLQKCMQRLTGKFQPERPPTPPSCQIEPLPATQTEEFRLPVSAPEHREQLTEMRALANNSTRMAMAESWRVQQVLKMRRAYFETKAASIASITVAIAFFATRSTVALTSAVILFLAAAFLAVRFVRLCVGKAPRNQAISPLPSSGPGH